MASNITRPDADQLRFTSSRTGNWTIEEYLESAEFGNRTLANLLSDIFYGDGTLKLAGLGIATIANGGTNSDTADGALTNLGGTTVGKAVFKATDAAAARSAMAALGTADTITLAVNSSNAVVTNDDANTATQYPTFAAASSGNNAMKVASTKLTFKPSVGLLGLGVAVSGGTLPGAEAGSGGGFYNNSSSWTSITQNSYWNGTNWIAKFTGAGGMYQAGAGTHAWYSFASVAGAASQTPVTTLSLDATGNLTATANVTAYSDERLKDNWLPLDEDFIPRLAAVKTGTYDRTDIQERQVGVSAQSLSRVLPEAVMSKGDGMLSVAYGNAALAACVMLARQVEMLKAEINELKGKA